jgi:hypothetical protein
MYRFAVVRPRLLINRPRGTLTNVAAAAVINA